MTPRRRAWPPGSPPCASGDWASRTSSTSPPGSCANVCMSAARAPAPSRPTSRACTRPSCWLGSPASWSGSGCPFTSPRPCTKSVLTRRLRGRAACTRAGSCARRRDTRPRCAPVPLNSSMITTAPLPEDVWERIGWRGEEVMSDQAHAYVYLQRTADGRIAIGGRGVPYRFASRTDAAGETAPATAAALRRRLAQMFPCARDVPIEDAWSGVLGVPRDWCPTVAADGSSGIAWAGGYVGQGVAAANLAGRTLRDLLLERETPLTSLPWVGRAPRRWEPEPLRWPAIRGVYLLYRVADRHEQRSGKPSRLAGLADAISRRR